APKPTISVAPGYKAVWNAEYVGTDAVTGDLTFVISTDKVHTVTFILGNTLATEDDCYFDNIDDGSILSEVAPLPRVSAPKGYKVVWDPPYNGSLAVREDLVFTAEAVWDDGQWHTVTFNLAGRGTSSDQLVFENILDGTLLKDSDVVVPNVTANVGYTFLGWYPAYDEETVVDRDLIYFAVYKEPVVPTGPTGTTNTTSTYPERPSSTTREFTTVPYVPFTGTFGDGDATKQGGTTAVTAAGDPSGVSQQTTAGGGGDGVSQENAANPNTGSKQMTGIAVIAVLSALTIGITVRKKKDEDE
ncbi:MAG: LPXTG cell wall anchor domain-containing protein, partial [Oscillospiraceae bacterium]|nr:LPXTG cell wall anchor domain-containing protein [Oscillospiraceae bacterium]